MKPPLRILQISDTHLRAEPAATLLGVDTAASLAGVLEQALAEGRPDAVLATGDLVHEEAAAYARFRYILSERYDGPWLALPGNHDLGRPLQQSLGQADTLNLGDWDVLAFDSHADGQASARFSAADRSALLARLRASAARHVLLACHHPPLPVGCPWLDKDCIPGGCELLESCAADGRVRALVCGHVHQSWCGRHAGIDVLTVPSTCFQSEPGSSVFTIDRRADSGLPGYRWLTLGTDGVVGTEVGRLAGYSMTIDLSDRA